MFVPAEVRGVLWVENQTVFLRLARAVSGSQQWLCFGLQCGVSKHIATNSRTGPCPVLSVECIVCCRPSEAWENSGGASGHCPVILGIWISFTWSILANLRMAFPDTEAWQPGYGRMLTALSSRAKGNRPEGAGSINRPDPGHGCGYKHHVLLPALARSRLAIDQEFVDWDSKTECLRRSSGAVNSSSAAPVMASCRARFWSLQQNDFSSMVF